MDAINMEMTGYLVGRDVPRPLIRLRGIAV
jgi:hypothetical protein